MIALCRLCFTPFSLYFRFKPCHMVFVRVSEHDSIQVSYISPKHLVTKIGTRVYYKG